MLSFGRPPNRHRARHIHRIPAVHAAEVHHDQVAFRQYPVATSSFLLWATAAKECGADLTRACMLEELAKVTSWTAGGLHAETSPGENMPPQCGLVLKLNGTSFERFDPEAAGEYDCAPEYIAEVTGPVVDRVALDENRVATKFQG